jgi:hypothetical protein
MILDAFMRVHVLVPWLTTTPNRERWLRTLLHDIASQVGRLQLSSCILHLHVNGPGRAETTERLLRSVPSDLSVLLTSDPVPSKIASVHCGADLATRSCADALVVVDNDVILPSGAIDSLLLAFRASSTPVATATKAPLTGRWSTNFQVLYSYAVQVSFGYQLFPKRATGSFYVIDPSIVRSLLPEGCNEGDLLSKAGAIASGVTIKSEYARSFELEVARRVRHLEASSRFGFQRLHADPLFASDAMLQRLPDAVDRARFVASLELWARVHEAAGRRFLGHLDAGASVVRRMMR